MKKKKKSGRLNLSGASPEEIADVMRGKLHLLGKMEADMSVEALSSNLPSLDAILGVGGLPVGRMVELYGPEQSGKTSLALHFAAQAQAAGGKAAYIDVEQALDLDMVKWFGVDMDKLLFQQPDSAEEAINLVLFLVKTRAVDIIVVDSVDSLVPQSELDADDIGKATMGTRARLMSKSVRMLRGEVRKAKVIIIFINQIRMKIGVMFGNPETTSGGGALKYYCGIRMDVRKKEILKGKNKKGKSRIIGIESKIRIVKNKVAQPFRHCNLQLIYGKGWREIND